MEEKNLTGYPSVDRPWLEYYRKEIMNITLPECTVYQNIYEHNKDYPNDIALLYFGKKITYKQLFCEVEKTEKAFISLGVKRGENVVLCTPATPETIYAILAINKIGANANMLNPTFSGQQLAGRINETDAVVLIVVNELYGCIKDIISKTCIKTVISYPAANCFGAIAKLLKKTKDIPNTVSWDRFIRMGKNISSSVENSYQKDMPAIMVYSSGTTGVSKGIQLTNDGLNATILQYEVAGFVMKRQNRYFAQIPVWFSTGISVTILTPLCLGVTVILEPMYDFELFYRHIVKYKPHYMVTATAFLDYLMNKKHLNDAYGKFKYLVAGGEYVTPQAERRFNEWLKENNNLNGLYKGYGMCECGGTITSSISQCNKIGTAGIPLPHVVVAAFDLNSNQELPYGKRGEIRVLTPCRMLGYFKNPEATSKYFFTDSFNRTWACTGDMGYVDKDGNVYVDGRLSDSYANTRSETIYLFDIERVIQNVETVRQCKVVVSRINNEMTHIVHLALSCAAEENILLQIKNVCLDKLPENHQPHLIKMYKDALPVAPSGKLDSVLMRNDTKDLIDLDEY